jgi:hypothetical protein
LNNFLINGSGKLKDLLDLSFLRFKERDSLELAVRSFCTNTSSDINRFWDHRLRGYYKERYDSRNAIADFDYYNSVKAKVRIHNNAAMCDC